MFWDDWVSVLSQYTSASLALVSSFSYLASAMQGMTSSRISALKFVDYGVEIDGPDYGTSVPCTADSGGTSSTKATCTTSCARITDIIFRRSSTCCT